MKILEKTSTFDGPGSKQNMSYASMTEHVKSSTRDLLHSTSQLYRRLTSSARLLPDFLIIGGQRCGTSSLYYYLLEHQQIGTASTKELHFFDDHFEKGLNWYRAQFPLIAQKYYAENIGKHQFFTGEASPYYLFHPQAPRRIARLLPHVNLIALLRNPIDRAYSQHWLEMKGKYETLPFEKAIQAEPERTAGEREKLLADEHYHSFEHRRHTYLTRGIYADQLEYWMNFFPREQFLILRSEDLYTTPAEVVKQTLHFLGIADSAITVEREYQKYKVPSKTGYRNKDSAPKLDPALRASLVEYFKPHNARLHQLLGRDFAWDN